MWRLWWEFLVKLYKVQLNRMEAKVDGLQTTVDELKATVDEMKATIDDQPTRAELFAVAIVLVLVVVIIFGLFFWQIQRRWSAHVERLARRYGRYGSSCSSSPGACPSSPGARSHYSRHPSHPASAQRILGSEAGRMSRVSETQSSRPVDPLAAVDPMATPRAVQTHIACTCVCPYL